MSTNNLPTLLRKRQAAYAVLCTPATTPAFVVDSLNGDDAERSITTLRITFAGVQGVRFSMVREGSPQHTAAKQIHARELAAHQARTA